MEVSSIPTFGMAYLRTIIQGSLTDTKRQPLRERQIALEDAIAECGVLRAQRLAVSSGSSFQTRLSGVQTQASRWMKELEEELSNDVAQFWRDVRAKAVVPHDQRASFMFVSISYVT